MERGFTFCIPLFELHKAIQIDVNTSSQNEKNEINYIFVVGIPLLIIAFLLLFLLLKKKKKKEA
ncbi:MAG: hypothetical protein WC821_01095 [archaeon]